MHFNKTSLYYWPGCKSLLTLSSEQFHTCGALNSKFITDLEREISFTESVVSRKSTFHRGPGSFRYLVKDLCRYVRLCIKEVEDIAGVLDSVFGCLLWGGEAVVA